MSNPLDQYDVTPEEKMEETLVMQEAPAAQFISDEHEDVHDQIESPMS